MTGEIAQKKSIGFETIAELANAQEKQVEAAGTSLSETAKWIVSGIAVTTAGVLVGTSLSSLGSMELGPRLIVALLSVAAGFCGLGFLFAFAIKVIAPPSLTLQDFADGRGLTLSWAKKIELRAVPLLKGLSITNLGEFCDYLRDPNGVTGAKLSEDDWLSLKETRRLVSLTANSELRRLLFEQLVRATYAMTPVIAIAVVLFAWAANPAKNEMRKMPAPIDQFVEVNPDDVGLLREVLKSPTCLESRLHVIIIGEWKSGMRDVVTVPRASCPPVRLRLDQGRFSRASP